MSLEKEFLPCEEALEMKKLGFDEPCFGFYFVSDGMFVQDFSKKQYDNSCQAPLYQQAFRWFREKHKQDKEIRKLGDNYWYVIKFPKRVEYKCHTYEEAELACLRELIEIVKSR